MGSFNRSDSKHWWRDGEYMPKHSKWLLESIKGAFGTVKEIVKIIEETDEEEMKTPSSRAEIRRDLREKVNEMCKSYFELAEQHDQLVGANHTHVSNQNKPSDQNSQSSHPVKAKQLTRVTRLQSLREGEIEEAIAPYNALAEQLRKVESELAMVKNGLAKKEEMLFNSEKLNHQQKKNLELLQHKVELQEKELKEKREEVERTKPRLNEMELNKVILDNRVSVLEKEIKILNVQKVSKEERISTLTKDLNLLNETKENLVKDRLRDKERVEMQGKELEQKKEEIEKMKLRMNEMETRKVSSDNRASVLEEEIKNLNFQKVSYEEKISNLQKTISSLNETKENVEQEVGFHLRDKENLHRNLSFKIEEASKVNSMQKETLVKYEIEKELFSGKNAMLQSSLSKANFELEALREKVIALEGQIEVLKKRADNYVEKNNILEIYLSNLKRELECSKAKLKDAEENAQNIVAEKEKVCTKVALLEEEIKKLSQKLEETDSSKLEAEKTICKLKKEIEMLNERKHSSMIIINKFVKKMLIWREAKEYLSKSPAWRKIECRSSELHFWLNSFCGFLFRFLGPINYHLGRYIGSMRTVLYFYGTFLAARFSSKRVTDEIDSDLSKSNNAPIKIKDGTDGEVEVNGASQLEVEVQENELQRQDELLCKREDIEKNPTVSQEECEKQVEMEAKPL